MIRGAIARRIGVAALVSSGCGGSADPRPQWLVRVSTDAVTPQFADRLRLEVVDDEAAPCAACVHQIGVDATSSPSFGVLPPASGKSPRVRAILFRADQQGPDGKPQGEAHWDMLGRLPALDGVTRVSFHLPMSCFGVLADPASDSSCDPGTRALIETPTLRSESALVPGSWSEARSVDCASAPPADMACIPGGAYLMGSRSAVSASASDATFPEHLVGLSPFFLDVHEVTVGDVRKLLASGALDPTFAPQVRDPNPNAFAGACSYLGPDDPTNDAFSVDCIGWESAKAVCEARGLRLPSEAEWEYAARNELEQTTFPWGSDPDICAHAVVGLGRSNALTDAKTNENGACRSAADGTVLPPGPVAGGSPLDKTRRGIQDMGGSVAEWVADRVQLYTEACWQTTELLLVNPICDTASPELGDQRSIRGGSWNQFPYFANGVRRYARVSADFAPGIGVRCAKSP